MGLICSIMATASLCFNRIIKWFSCVCVLGGIMLCMMIIVAYGITIGYQTAQEELARFAVKAREVNLSFTPIYNYGKHKLPVRAGRYDLLRRSNTLLNHTIDNSSSTSSILEFYDKKPPNETLDEFKETPVFIEFTKSTFSTVSRSEETPIEEITEPEPSDKLIERARRSKDPVFDNPSRSFWRSYKANQTILKSKISNKEVIL